MDNVQLSRPPKPIEIFTLADMHVREVNEAAREGRSWRVSMLKRDLSRRVKEFAATLPPDEATAFRERLNAELADMELDPVAMNEVTANVIVIIISSVFAMIFLAIIMMAN